MQLLTLGLNYETASLDLRERVAFSGDGLVDAVRDLTSSGMVREAAIVSTCNRTEIYCGKEKVKSESILQWISAYSGLQQQELRQYVYQYPNEQAVKHAFRVASGLDSMVIGEPQILGQMKSAFALAHKAGTTGKLLNRLFQHTFSVAKQVRTDTSIGASAVSVAYAGVDLAKRIFTRLPDQTALLIGAGETIELVARHLKQNEIKHIIIANRSIERAETLANDIGCEAIALSEIPNRLSEADILVSSTASTLPILGKGAVENALKIRRHRPMFILDLAVPRDVEKEVAQLRDVYMYTVDDLQSIVEENLGARREAAKEAEKIIDLQTVRFMRWMRSLDSVPTIRALRDNLESTRQIELDKALRRINNGASAEEALEQMSRSLTNKFTHSPSQSLKQADIEGNSTLITSARKLFGL